MIKITIEGETVGQVAALALAIAGQMGATPAEGADAAPAPKPRAKKGAATPAEPKQDGATASTAPSQEQDEVLPDDELARELAEPVDPMPETAKAVVDAGTGKPAEQTSAPIQMTFDDVKAAAAKLAAANTPKLVELLKKYGAPNLSGVPQDKLADFASDVLAELG